MAWCCYCCLLLVWCWFGFWFVAVWFIAVVVGLFVIGLVLFVVLVWVLVCAVGCLRSWLLFVYFLLVGWLVGCCFVCDWLDVCLLQLAVCLFVCCWFSVG